MSELDITISDLNDISEILDNNGYGGWCKTLDKAVELLKEQKNLIDCLVEDQVKKIDEMEELLKEKQSVKPTNDKGNFCCGSCGNPLHTAIINPMIRFCDHCGRPVDWKDGDGE